jgi:hypothetical protein
MHLEMHMRQHSVPLCGRDHMAYRSAYFPVKGCIDGDLCEQVSSVSRVLMPRSRRVSRAVFLTRRGEAEGDRRRTRAHAQ